MQTAPTVDLEFIQVEPTFPPGQSIAARQRGKNKKGKKKKGGKPGKKSHFVGVRAEFLERFLTPFIALKGAARASQNTFWSQLFALFWATFPYWYALDEDPSLDPRPAPEETPEELVEKGRIIADMQKRIKAHLRYRRALHFRKTKNPWDGFFPDVDTQMNPPPGPRQLAPWQLYMSKKTDEIDTEFKARWPTAGLEDTQKFAFRCKIARELLERESPEFKVALEAEVENMHEDDLQSQQEMRDALEVPVELDIQIQARETIAGIVQPLLEAVRKRTGYYITMLCGIPLLEGSREFQLKVITAGKTSGVAPLPWHLAEQERFKSDVMGSFTRFLTMTKEYEERLEKQGIELGPSSTGNTAAQSGCGSSSALPSPSSPATSSPNEGQPPNTCKKTKPSSSQKGKNSKTSKSKTASKAASKTVSKTASKGKGKASGARRGRKGRKGSHSDSESESDSDFDSDSSSSSSSSSSSDESDSEDDAPPAENLITYDDPPADAVIPTLESLKLSEHIIAFYKTLTPEEQRVRLYWWGTYDTFGRTHMVPTLVAKEAEQRAKRAAATTMAPATGPPLSSSLQPRASQASPTSSTPLFAPPQHAGSAPNVTTLPNAGTTTIPDTLHVTRQPDAANTTTRDAANTTTRDAANTTTRDDVNTTTRDTANTTTRDDANTTTRDDANTTTRDDANTTTRDDANTTTRDDANTTTRDDASMTLRPEDVIIVNEDGWPAWLRDGYNYLEGQQLGHPFMQAVDWWTVLERSYNWEKTKKGFGLDHRPPQLDYWMRVQRRSYSKVPLIDSEVEYATSWWKWWGGLQPEWRERDSQGRPIRGGSGDWEELRKPGQNGFMMVLLSLSWWKGVASNATLSLWEDAVKDVAWVIMQMGKALTSQANVSKKHALPSEDEVVEVRSKRARRSLQN